MGRGGGDVHPDILQENLKSRKISEEKSKISECWEKKKIDSSSAVSAFFNVLDLPKMKNAKKHLVKFRKYREKQGKFPDLRSKMQKYWFLNKMKLGKKSRKIPKSWKKKRQVSESRRPLTLSPPPTTRSQKVMVSCTLFRQFNSLNTRFLHIVSFLLHFPETPFWFAPKLGSNKHIVFRWSHVLFSVSLLAWILDFWT